MADGPRKSGPSAGTPRGNLPPLELYVPEPRFRPGDPVDFAHFDVPAAGAQPRPDEGCAANETHPLCSTLVRVLGEDDLAHGPWDPRLDPETLRRMLRVMALAMPVIREVLKMRYLWEHPMELKDPRLDALLGPDFGTPFEDAVGEAVTPFFTPLKAAA